MKWHLKYISEPEYIHENMNKFVKIMELKVNLIVHQTIGKEQVTTRLLMVLYIKCFGFI